jgi:hypothetical protein
MATPVSICSNALQALGAAPIADFNEPNDRARLCANLYPVERDALLRTHTWNCAVRRVQLSPTTDGVAYGFRRSYLLPGDWVRTLKVGGFSDYTTDFRHEGRRLLANADPLFLRYVFRNENVGEWDDLLVRVMQARMTYALCYAVTKSTSLRAEMRQEYMLALQEAKSIDSMGEPSDEFADQSPLIACRY